LSSDIQFTLNTMSSSMSSWANAESSDEDEPVAPSQHIASSTAGAAGAADAADAAGESEGGHRHSEDARQHRPRDRSERGERDYLSVCVGNLSYTTTEQALGDFFVDGGCKVKNVQIPHDPEGKSRGFGFIEFEDRESAELALKANNEELNGRHLKVEPKFSRPSDHRGGGRGGRGEGREGREGRGDVRERRHDHERGRGGRDSREGREGRENRYRHNDDIDWTKREQLPEREPRGDRDGGRGRGPGGRGRRDRPEGDALPSPPVPTERPKMNLLPRTKPLEARHQAPNSQLFGDGKAREFAVPSEVCLVL
jgi:hypothetical protein